MFNKHNLLMRRRGEIPALAGFFVFFQAAEQGNNTPWWLILLIAIVVLLLLFAPELTGWGQEQAISTEMTSMNVPASSPEAEPLRTIAEAPASKSDNLSRIEGIGPKTASLLREANITTFDQLAATEVDYLKQMLKAAKLHMIDPTSWPEQAGLAATGEWEALKALQERLKGGRRT